MRAFLLQTVILLGLVQFGVTFPMFGIYILIPWVVLGIIGFIIFMLNFGDPKLKWRDVEIFLKFTLFGLVSLVIVTDHLFARRREKNR